MPQRPPPGRSVARPLRIDPVETDRELVQRARRGDRWAEEALYHRHVRGVARVVSRLLARSVEAEDVVQDTFIEAFRDLDRLQDPSAFGRWLQRVAVHQVHRRFRRRRLLRALGLDRGEDDLSLVEQADPGAGPDVLAELRELDRVLDRLSPERRVAWVLRYVEGQTLDEVAEICGRSLATIKRQIAAAQREIAAHVAIPSWGEGE